MTKIILFEVALLLQKNRMRAVYAERGIEELWSSNKYNVA